MGYNYYYYTVIIIIKWPMIIWDNYTNNILEIEHTRQRIIMNITRFYPEKWNYILYDTGSQIIIISSLCTVVGHLAYIKDWLWTGGVKMNLHNFTWHDWCVHLNPTRNLFLWSLNIPVVCSAFQHTFFALMYYYYSLALLVLRRRCCCRNRNHHQTCMHV